MAEPLLAAGQLGWSALLFGVGLLGLLYAFRRTIFLRARSVEPPTAARLELQRRQARAELDQINAAQWLAQYRRAWQFPRLSELTVLQQKQLAILTEWQRRHRGWP